MPEQGQNSEQSQVIKTTLSSHQGKPSATSPGGRAPQRIFPHLRKFTSLTKTRMCFPNFHLHLREIGAHPPCAGRIYIPYVDMHFEMHITAFRGLLEGEHVAANPATLNYRTRSRNPGGLPISV